MEKVTDEGAENQAYATLLTRPSYLAGAVLLAYTLYRHSPDTPLIIIYTPETLSASSVKALEAEAKHSNVILHAVAHLTLPDDGKEHGMVAERFRDTWTKLRVFELYTLPQRFGRICFLDADMLILRDPSPLIMNRQSEIYLKGGDQKRVMASHVCVCNLDADPWAPDTWRKENCAFTPCTSPSCNPGAENDSETKGIFNSGTFVFKTSEELAEFVKERFENMAPEKLRSMKFPDQDFLNLVFSGRWESLSWKTNSLKTWRYWHPNIWSDDQVAVLHYIVDKPWAARVTTDTNGNRTAGYLGKDGVTHQWWWDAYNMWHSIRLEQSEFELLDTVGRYVASENGISCSEMNAIGGGAQDFTKKWKSNKTSEGKSMN